jgi:hypothetical protein
MGDRETGTFRDSEVKTVANLVVRPDNSRMPRTARADLGKETGHSHILDEENVTA